MARLTRITTGSGDDGTTGIADGSRLGKDDPLMHAIGDIDELNASLGLLISAIEETSFRDSLHEIQQALFNVGGELSLPGTAMIDKTQLATLEQWSEVLNAQLPPLKEFVLPGGNEACARAHVARTVCRRAERSLVALSRQKPVNSVTLVYINRLSDALFNLARVLATQTQAPEITWKRET
ncbi:MAG: cob(I)yrinic acid a,c-diamide adenosyltransferase [bacterium]